MAATDPLVTIELILPVSVWEKVLTVEPMNQETYTDRGITIFNSFQKIHHAVNPDGGES